ncbi:MAG: N-acetylmannosamine-6-phosphate 2-epimerase [Candidatus Marinimicrobia bacterium]|nr:N-acetylmannosamine-6-phosphate 2-epimerase [Candidatus Neomarinimicrobiota bacterium]
MNKEILLKSLQNGLIVSVQADTYEPLGKPELLLAMAQAAVYGGAVGIRACYPENIRCIKNSVDVPVIGIYKKKYPDSEVFISATVEDCILVALAGPEIIAMDATLRKRPKDENLADIISELRKCSNALLMADVSTVNEGVKAIDTGFDIIGTTLSGYTGQSTPVLNDYTPDFALLTQLVKESDGKIPVIAEGRYWQPEDARRALDIGAFAVVVGSAITRPWLITMRFIEAMKRQNSS